MPQPADSENLTAIVGGACTLLGIAISQGVGYLKVRLREATGDRRSEMQGHIDLNKRLERRLDLYEKRLEACDLKHAQCQDDMVKLTIEVGELRGQIEAHDARERAAHI